MKNSFCKLQHRICANQIIGEWRKKAIESKWNFQDDPDPPDFDAGVKRTFGTDDLLGCCQQLFNVSCSDKASFGKSARFAQEVIQPSTPRASRLYGRARPISTQKNYFCQSIPECKLQVETMDLLEIMKAADYLDIRGLLNATSKVYQPYES